MNKIKIDKDNINNIKHQNEHDMKKYIMWPFPQTLYIYTCV